MQFGQSASPPEHELHLPPDHLLQFNFSKQSEALPLLHLAGTQWTQPQWKGTWYPDRTPAKEYLYHFSRLFSSIELNATHYRTYTALQLEGWANQTPDTFVFCPKLPQSISHYRRLRNCEEPRARFLEGLAGLGKKLGPCFLQMPDNFDISRWRDLYSFLENWPPEVELCVEVRHPSWFQPGEAAEGLPVLLHRLGMGFILTDTPLRRDVLHMCPTAPTQIVRYVGHWPHATDRQRLTEWIDRLFAWHMRGVSRWFMFMHQPGGVLTPEANAWFGEAAVSRGVVLAPGNTVCKIRE